MTVTPASRKKHAAAAGPTNSEVTTPLIRVSLSRVHCNRDYTRTPSIQVLIKTSPIARNA
eukprot:7342140-Lingulodinium_polyedra.AAC.1